ncbi:MAG: alpha/beta hydrolase [Planctomycetota bacterium]
MNLPTRDAGSSLRLKNGGEVIFVSTWRRHAAMTVLLASATFLGRGYAGEPKVVLLWPNGAPGAMGKEPADQPRLTITLPEPAKRNGTAVVICPGGGYGHLAIDHEGKQIAQWLVEHGIAAFMLEYRIAPRYHHPAPISDAQRAIRWVRANAKEFGVDPSRVGIWGFSAGGHLASTAATHFDDGNPKSADPVDRQGCRPDFAILCYPVITLKEPFAHMGSRRNLLGDSPDPALLESLCNETQVTEKTPPTFLMHTTEDKPVPPENSVLFYSALRKAGVPAELHLYEKGPHGVGLAPNDPILSSWPDRLADWLRLHGKLTKM